MNITGSLYGVMGSMMGLRWGRDGQLRTQGQSDLCCDMLIYVESSPELNPYHSLNLTAVIRNKSGPIWQPEVRCFSISIQVRQSALEAASVSGVPRNELQSIFLSAS